jgi:hypothetical protein
MRRKCLSTSEGSSYSNEGNPREPAHIHVRDKENEAKFWLSPQVVLARNDGFTSRDLRELANIIEANCKRFEEAWNEYFA